jgi:hypothetical protein
VIPFVPGQANARALVVLAVAVTLLVSACGASAASFDPTGPCSADGRAPGAYPELERQVPGSFEGRAADSVDSGRSCTAQGLGTLASRGVTELRYAGGTWKLGDRSGATLAIFSAPGLDAAALADFYEAGARAGRNTENVQRTTETVTGTTIERVETLNDQSFQTVAVLHSDTPGLVRVALVGSDVRESPGRAAHDALVARAVQALARG